MPTLSIAFKNLGLTVHATKSCRELMVKQNHETILTLSDKTTKVLTGTSSYVPTLVFKKDGAAHAGRAQRPRGERLVHLDWIFSTTPVLKADLKGLINADVTLPPGRLYEMPPEFKKGAFGVLLNEAWKFKTPTDAVVHEQMLTNVVRHESVLESRSTYTLWLDGTQIDTFDGSEDVELVFENNDNVGVVDPDPWDGQLSDFALLYDLLESPTDAPSVWTSKTYVSLGTGWTRPICPRAQIEE